MSIITLYVQRTMVMQGRYIVPRKRKLGNESQQEKLYFKTLSKVCFTLKQWGPLTMHAIHGKTRIHRTFVLPRALLQLTGSGAVIRRQDGKREYFKLNEENEDAKVFCEFYVANYLQDDVERMVTRKNEEMKQMVDKLRQVSDDFH